ncbi:uncharacterized protein LOC119651103 isoform X1 [Hermetia illucens]|uniref:uncharacterized protein LOC119651103 isoform X1 n=1 Tax=Hermetia illucens TaxID=343691 RepID=UPI0018CC2CA7|nr:uncharacterized protein LOC119651103 isoform X1 [Hermetia illucens]
MFSHSRIEWVEIIEPRTKEHMYANLTTGECVWDPPEGVPIKRADSSQWWELFDTNTQRFYYYNVASQTTVWHRPNNCDIIPLAKLQTLKQNTDPGDKRDGCTQTSHSKVRLQKTASRDSHHRHHSSTGGHARVQSAGASDAKSSSELLSSPHGRHSYRLPSSDTSLAGKSETYRYCRHSQGSTASHGSHKHKDSGKSSDSSLSSAHGYRRLHEGGSLRISNTQQHKSKHLSDNSYRILQESSSSHNIPHVPYGTAEKQQHYPHSKLSYSISNSSDLGGLSPTHSANTPILKKKLSSESSIHSKRDSCGGVSKHQSFDYTTGNAAIVSLTRSGSFMSSPTSSHHHHPPSSSIQSSLSPQQQQQSLSSSHRKASIDGNGGGSDDSMHEKYFKSVENTPVSRRRHTTSTKTSNKKHSSDSSPQSPISPQNNTHANKSARPSVLSSLSALEPPPSMCYNMSSSHKNDPDFINLDLTSKPEKYLDKMKLDKRSPNASCSGGGSSGSGIHHSSHSPIGGSGGGNLLSSMDHQQKINNSKSPNTSGGVKNSAQSSSSSQYPAVEKYNASLDQFVSRSNVDRHNKESRNAERSSGKHRKKHHTPSSDVEYDNGNISPLYSNWDQEMQEHLLPLQHYIIEQAKLSGCYGFGDTIDSDSFHSDSQSEHSLSGHEPDNEDSDHSDGHGDYLTHSYGLMGDYESNMGDGVSYYNYYMGYDRNDREEISDNVEAVLENEKDTQIYSPVRGHPFYSPSAQPKPIQQIKIPSPARHIPVPDFREPLKSKQNDDNLSQSQKSTTSFLSSSSLGGSGTGAGGAAVKGGNVSQLAIMKECDIEKFAQDNINLHSKGIFRKKSSLRDMLSWTGNAISRPMLALARDKAGKKMATELFKLVQIYMGDRKARAGMSLNSVAIDIINTALGQQQLRDELYVQLCRQTTENPKRESLIRGWELMAICLSYVPPSPTFQPALLNYMNRHRDPTFATSFPDVGKWPIHVQISHYATVCCRRLDRIGNSSKRPIKKPTDDEIEQARGQILRDSMFGNTLHEVMELQKDKYPERKLPWIQVTLSEQVLLLNGKQTEGIFRVSADVDEVNCLKSRLDRWEVPEHKNTMDAHAPASLLKLWYRELYDPLIPDELYSECVQTEDPEEADRIINKLPSLNKLVLMYLIHFLQQFSQPDVVQCTKMDSSNLAMVFAPNCLRCTSDDPKVILENARKEMAFMRTLIQHMDTTAVTNLV